MLWEVMDIVILIFSWTEIDIWLEHYISILIFKLNTIVYATKHLDENQTILLDVGLLDGCEQLYPEPKT